MIILILSVRVFNEPAAKPCTHRVVLLTAFARTRHQITVLVAKNTSFLGEILSAGNISFTHDGQAFEGNLWVPQGTHHVHPLLAVSGALQMNPISTGIVSLRCSSRIARPNANFKSTILLVADHASGFAAQDAAITKPIAIGNIFNAVAGLVHRHVAALAKHNLIAIQALAAETNATNCIVAL